MKKFSLRVRLVLSFFVITSVVWVSFGVLSWNEAKEEINEFFDTYQLILARQFSATHWNDLAPETQEKTNEIINSLLHDGDDDDDALGFAVFNSTGKMIFHDSENGKYFPFNDNPVGFKNQELINKDEVWRIMWMKSADGNYIIAVGQELEYRNEMAFEMIEQSMVPWLLGLLCQILASIALIYKELSPIREIAKKISKRHPNDLSPITDPVPSEIAPLIHSINKLFTRVEKMITKERSFISDAAHELRSPLTALKVQLEVASLSPEDEETRNTALQKLEYGIERSSRLIEQLLALSRLESVGNKHMDEHNIDWEKIVKDVINEQQDIIHFRNPIINVSRKGKFIKKGESLLLSLMLKNLLNNAIKYSPKKSNIDIVISDKTLCISNEFEKPLDDAQFSRLGERFFRPAGQNESGSGLGISIVKRIAKIHDCDTHFDMKDNKFIATIKMP